jgi:Flp pilus assembly protein TadG
MRMGKAFPAGWRQRLKPRAAQQQAARRSFEEGQSILEMALAFPVLILLLAAVVDLGRAFDGYIVLTNAAREGARYNARDPSLEASVIQQLVADDVVYSGTNATNMADFDTSNVEVLVELGGAVTVTVTYDFELWFGGMVGLDTIQLQKEAVMPVMTGF